MSNLIIAKQSPRYENNKFYWYENDTFSIELTINFTNTEDGSELIIEPNDKVVITFFRHNIPIHKFIYNNFKNGGKFLMTFTDEISKKFKAGTYEYTITYIGDNRTTIVSKNIVEVEK